MGTPLKVVIINKSDSTGGAAVVSMRLLEALRRRGIDARMLVAEKKRDSAFVELADSNLKLRRSFMAERLKIFMANGFNRETLFKIDTASDGVPLHRHRWVCEADVVCLNWVNQGLLSLEEIKKIEELGKPVVWTMHDMWNFTGVCHHAYGCDRFTGECGLCPLLGKSASESDISRDTFLRKRDLYAGGGIRFVAVSQWLARKAAESGLSAVNQPIVIPNAFDLKEPKVKRGTPGGKFRILFGAARIDDPVKGLPTLVASTQRLAEKYPDVARRCELILFGGIKNPESLEGIAIPHKHIGTVASSNLEDLYTSCHAVVSTSLWETLPGTLVEGQAYGCAPVALDHGGQSDIIEHKATGWLAPWSDSEEERADAIAEGLVWASQQGEDTRSAMYESVAGKFSYDRVGAQYEELFHSLLGR